MSSDTGVCTVPSPQPISRTKATRRRKKSMPRGLACRCKCRCLDRRDREAVMACIEVKQNLWEEEKGTQEGLALRENCLVPHVCSSETLLLHG